MQNLTVEQKFLARIHATAEDKDPKWCALMRLCVFQAFGMFGYGNKRVYPGSTAYYTAGREWGFTQRQCAGIALGWDAARGDKFKLWTAEGMIPCQTYMKEGPATNETKYGFSLGWRAAQICGLTSKACPVTMPTA